MRRPFRLDPKLGRRVHLNSKFSVHFFNSNDNKATHSPVRVTQKNPSEQNHVRLALLQDRLGLGRGGNVSDSTQQNLVTQGFFDGRGERGVITWFLDCVRRQDLSENARAAKTHHPRNLLFVRCNTRARTINQIHTLSRQQFRQLDRVFDFPRRLIVNPIRRRDPEEDGFAGGPVLPDFAGDQYGKPGAVLEGAAEGVGPFVGDGGIEGVDEIWKWKWK